VNELYDLLVLVEECDIGLPQGTTALDELAYLGELTQQVEPEELV